MKKIIIFIVLFSSVLNIFAQKRIKAKGDYTHLPTQFVFPTQIENFQRVNIYSFDKKKKNVGVVYGNNKTTVTLYVYPAGNGDENRLRDEYLTSMQSIANTKWDGINATQHVIQYKGDYICNGINAVVKDKHSYNSLTLYECGRWFFKIRITSDNLDSLYLSEFEQKLLKQFEPSKLTALNPFNSQVDVHIAPVVIKSDSIFFGSVLGYTFEKIKWALDSISENERASGFPSIHLGMHIAAIKAFLNFQKEKCQTCTATAETKQMLSELQEILDNGFLEEFILDRHNMLLNFDDYVISEEDWENYLKWKGNRTFLFDMQYRLYSVLIYI